VGRANLFFRKFRVGGSKGTVGEKDRKRNSNKNMTIETWPIARPIPYARNARKIPQSAIDKVAASIREFGFRQPLVVDTERVIIAGHVRLLAAQKLELKEVPVHVAQGLTPAQVRAYRLMDNRSHQDAEWDLELLAPELSDLNELAFDLLLTAFDKDELAELLAEKTEGLTDEDEAPAVQAFAITERGDLWILGKHRLLCEDSTLIDAVNRLMDGEKADLVFTDPPYNVDYEGYTEERLTIQGDLMDAARFSEFLSDTFVSLRSATKTEGSLYVCHSSSWQREFQKALEDAGFEVRC
jgi:ParB-like chromosome segregation protein Spo0J